MKFNNKTILAVISLLLFYNHPILPQDVAGLDKERINLENDFQVRIENALSKLIDQKSFVSIVNVELGEEKMTISQNDRTRTYELPGVPKRTRVGEKEEIEQTGPIVIYKYSIKKITVILTLDINIPENRITEIKEIVTKLVGMDVKRGDVLDIRKTNMYIKQEVQPQVINAVKRTFWQKIWFMVSTRKDVVWIVVIGLVTVVLAVFLFGPLRKFFVELTNILPRMKIGGEIQTSGLGGLPGGKSGGEGGSGAGGEGGWGGSGRTTLSLEKPKLGDEDYPFSYINKKNMDKFCLLIKEKTPEQVAIAVNYLPSEIATEVLSRVDPKVRAQVLMTIPWERQFTPEEVISLDKEIKRNINYLIGGMDIILNLYESAGKETQLQMMQILSTHRPDVVDKIRQKYIEFEDLMLFSNTVLRTILREVPLRSLAIAFKNASEELKNMVFEVLPEGMSQILREEIEFSQTVSDTRITEEQRRIIQLVRRLGEEGRIEMPNLSKAVREKAQVQKKTESPVAVKPEEKIQLKKTPEAAAVIKTEEKPAVPAATSEETKVKSLKTDRPDIAAIAKLLEQRRQQKKRK